MAGITGINLRHKKKQEKREAHFLSMVFSAVVRHRQRLLPHFRTLPIANLSFFSTSRTPAAADRDRKPRILILGSGWAGEKQALFDVHCWIWEVELNFHYSICIIVHRVYISSQIG